MLYYICENCIYIARKTLRYVESLEQKSSSKNQNTTNITFIFRGNFFALLAYDITGMMATTTVLAISEIVQSNSGSEAPLMSSTGNHIPGS